MLSYVPNHSTAKLQKWSNYDELHRFDVKTIKNVELRPKPFKTTQTYKVIKVQWIASIWCQKHQTTQNYKSDQITMNCMDLTSKRTKMLSYVPNHSKQRKSTKVSKYNELHRFDVKNIKQRKTTKVIKLRWIGWIRRQNERKTTNQSKQRNLQRLSMYNELHRFDVKTIKMLSYVPNHSKQRKTTKVIKLQWIASIWCQNDKNVELRPKPFQTTQTYKSNQITMNCIDLTSKRSKMLSYVPNHSNTTQNYKSDQITMKCMDLTSKRTKMLSYVPNHSKQRKTTKVIKLRWIGSIWRQNDQKCWVTSQTIQNNSNLQK